MPDYVLSATATFDGSNFNSGVSRATSALDRFKSACDRTSTRSSSSLTKFAGVATKVAGIVSGIATGAIIKGGIERALNIEQAEYKLKQMGMDVQKVMESVNTAAKGTRFGLDSVATVASSLGASGVQAGEEMTGSLKAITGMATLTGRSVEQIGLIYGKVAAQGRVQGDELMQFSEAGINVTDALAKHFGTTQAAVREMVRAGEVDFANFSAAMQEAYGEAAYGANETFSGALANVNAALSRMSEKFAKPALDSLKGVFQNAIPAIDALSSSLEPISNKFGQFVGDLGERASSGLQRFIEVLNQTQSPLQAFKAAISETFGTEWGGAINSIIDALTNVGSVIGDVIKWFASLDAGTQTTIASLVAFGAAFRPIISLLASGASKIAGFAKGGASVVRFFNDVGTSGGKAAVQMRLFGANAQTASSGAQKMASAAQQAGSSISQIGSYAVTATHGMKQIGTTAQTAQYSLTKVGSLSKTAGTNFKAIGTAAQSSAKGLSSASQSITKAASETSKLSSVANVAKGALMSLGTGLAIGGIVTVVSMLADGFMRVQQRAADFKNVTDGLDLSSFTNGMKDAASGADNFSTHLSSAVDDLDTVIHKNAELNDSITQSFYEVGTNSGLLEYYENVITTLANTGQQLDEISQQKLKQAVDGFNQLAGTEIKITDINTGAIDQAVESVHRYADAWKAAALQQAASQAAAEKMSKVIEAQIGLQGAQEALQNRQREVQNEFATADDTWKKSYVGAAKQWVSDWEAVLAAAEGDYNKLIEIAAGMQNSLAATPDALKSAAQGSEAWGSALQSLGDDTDAFFAKLSESQISMEDFAKLQPEQAQALVDSWRNGEDNLIDTLNSFSLDSQSKAQEAVAGISEALSGLGEGESVNKLADSFGLSVDTMAQKLNEFGVTADEVSNMTPQSFQKMADAMGTSADDLVTRFDDAGVEIPEAVRTWVAETTAAVDQANQTFSNLGEGADFTKFAKDLGMGLDQASSTFNEKFSQMSEISEQTVREMSLAFERTPQEIISALSSAGISIPDAVKNMFAGAPEAAAEKGTEIGEAGAQTTSESMANGATEGGDEYISKLLSTAQGHEGEFTAIGLSLGNSLSTGFAQADMMSTQTSITNLIVSLSARTAELMAIGTSWGNALSTGFAAADMMSTQGSIGLLISSLAMRTAELQAIGTSWGNALSTGFAAADMMSTQGAIGMLTANLSARTAEFTAIGTSWGNALSTGFAAADMASASASVSAIVAAISGHTGEFMSAGVAAGGAYASGFASSNISGAAQAVSSLLGAVQGMAGMFTAAGTEAGNAYTSGFSAADMTAPLTLIQNVVTQIQALSSEFMAAGQAAGEGYTSGLQTSGSMAIGVAQSIATSAAAALTSAAGTAFASGSHLGAQFAAGIRSQAGAVAAAAASLAAAAKANIGHSKPKEGPLRMGEEIFGVHLAQNFAKGIEQGVVDVGKSAYDLAQTVYDYIGHSYPKKGPLSVGEEHFGQEAGLNFAKGIGGEISLNAAAKASETLAGKTIESLLNGLSKGEAAVGQKMASMMQNAADQAVDVAKSFSSQIADAIMDGGDPEKARAMNKALSDFIWGDLAPAIDKPYQLPTTGATYDAMKAIEDAGFTLDKYKDAVNDASKADEKLVALTKELSVSVEDLEKWQGLYNLKKEIIEGSTEAQDASGKLTALFARSGVAFTKDFVERIADGSDEMATTLSNLTELSDSSIQELVDSYSDLARAEREQEINTRSLWVNSLGKLNAQGQNAKDWLLDFRETCLDVKEALYSDSGLSGAFDFLGVSVEGFALDLQSLDTDMESFVSDVEGFSEKVSDGFNLMKRDKNKGFSFWVSNLERNMVEATAYAENIQDVMAKIPESIDSDAFRKAVLEGGYDTWGQVMRDMAKLDSDQIAEAVQTYNDSIAIAQTSMIAQYQALAPGEEMMRAMMESMTSAIPEAASEMGSTISTMATAVTAEATAQFGQLGGQIASSIGDGFSGQIGAVSGSLSAGITSAVASSSGGFSAAGAQLMAAMAEGISSGEGVVVGAVTAVVSAAVAAAQAGVSQVNTILSSVGGGVAAGASAVAGAAADMTQASLDAIADTAKIGSPSKVTFGFGTDLAQGLANGLRSNSAPVGESTRLANSMLDSIDRMGSILNDVGSSASEAKEQEKSLFQEMQEKLSLLNNYNKLLGSIAEKTGVAFSKPFMEAIESGGEKELALLQQLNSLDPEAAQKMVDTFTEVEREERRQKISARRLYVQSLALTRGQKDLADTLLDVQEATLDVQEAIYSNSSLYSAFANAGTSAEKFASNLISLDMTMDDFTQTCKSMADQVSNGFKRMTLSGQTSFAAWKRNLRRNIKESQEFTSNLEKVMAAIPDSLDSQAFRQAVLEGGYDEWGRVIKQLSRKSASEISEAVSLFAEAVSTGQQNAFRQVGALGTGDEYMAALSQEIQDSSDDVTGQVVSVFDQANDAVRATSGAWEQTGKVLASSLTSGMAQGLAQTTSIIANARTAFGRTPVYAMATPSTAGVTAGNSNTYYYGDVNVSATVRSDRDVRSLARELDRLRTREARAGGYYR